MNIIDNVSMNVDVQINEVMPLYVAWSPSTVFLVLWKGVWKDMLGLAHLLGVHVVLYMRIKE